MKHGYIRLTQRGADEAAQRAALAAAGVEEDRVHVDDQRKPVRVSPGNTSYPPLVARDVVTRICRRGDVVVVATPGRLGVSREDIRQAIGRVAERGASVQAADGIAFGSIELQALIAFETSAHLEVERERLAPARKALRRGEARKRTLTKVQKAKLLPLWRNTDEYTVEAVLQEALAMGVKVSRRTLYGLLGGRLEEDEPDGE